MPNAEHLKRPEKPTQKNLVLTPDDRQVFNWLLHHRFLRSDQIAALWQRSQYRGERRLRDLWQHHYLERPKDQLALWIQGDSTMVYGLADRAARELVRSAGLQGKDPLKTRWKTRSDRVSFRFLEHSLMLSHYGVCLRLTLRQHPDIELTWLQGREAYDKLQLRDRPDFDWERKYLTPDALIVLKHPDWKEERAFFIEADRGHIPLKEMEKRYKAYYYYWHDQVSPKYRWKDNGFGIERMRILTITETPARAESLRRLLKSTEQFLFSPQPWTLKHPERVLNSWKAPGHKEAFHLW